VWQGKNGNVTARLKLSMVGGLKDLQAAARFALQDAAFAGATVLYDELRLRAPVKTGTLRDSMDRFYAKSSTPARQTYYVGPNKKYAPHWYNVEFGHWRYNTSANGFFQKSKSNPKSKIKSPPGNWRAVHDLPGALPQPAWVPAHPYIRPSAAKIPESIEAMRLAFAASMRAMT
jgi:hypothetical protein